MAKTRRNRARKARGKANRNTRKNGNMSKSGNAGNAGESWPQAVKRVYLEMKKKNPKYKFKQAMSEASDRKRKGTL